MRKGIVEVGKTGMVYILDRETGKPLIGIEERAVPQEPRQATSATQPFPIGDSVVPLEVDIQPEGFKLIKTAGSPRRSGTSRLVKPRMAVNWPPSSYDPETQLFYVCANDGAAATRHARRRRVADADAGRRAIRRRRIRAVCRDAASLPP